MSLEQDFKSALSRWASGVSVVTTRDQGLCYGLTVSSFSSLSLDPPLVLVCIDNRNRLTSMVESSGTFCVSILERQQEEASNYFASRGREPVEEITAVPCSLLDDGVPAVGGALAHLSCDLHEAVAGGDHTILIGRVKRISVGEGVPLLYYARAYRGLTGL